MDPTDALVIVAIGLPLQQQIDLVSWWFTQTGWGDIAHPSLVWWADTLHDRTD